MKKKKVTSETIPLFKDKVSFECVKSVIGSGYETLVADLAIRDGVAYRAARKNMQIHSAIILNSFITSSSFLPMSS